MCLLCLSRVRAGYSRGFSVYLLLSAARSFSSVRGFFRQLVARAGLVCVVARVFYRIVDQGPTTARSLKHWGFFRVVVAIFISGRCCFCVRCPSFPTCKDLVGEMQIAGNARDA